MAYDKYRPESDNSGSPDTDPQEHRDISPGRLGDIRAVLEAIDRHNGEVAQQTLIEETGWSKSKTSYVVGDAVDLGLVVSVEYGRESYLYRPSTVPSEVEVLGRKVQEGNHEQ